MILTQETLLKIENWLKRRAMKDSSLPVTTVANNGDSVPIIQNGFNKRITVDNLLSSLQSSSQELTDKHFYNVSIDGDSTHKFISLSSAISSVPNNYRKPGIFVTAYINGKLGFLWRTYQFTGETTLWSDESKWIERIYVNPWSAINELENSIGVTDEDLLNFKTSTNEAITRLTNQSWFSNDRGVALELNVNNIWNELSTYALVSLLFGSTTVKPTADTLQLIDYTKTGGLVHDDPTILPAATLTTAGIMSASDKQELDRAASIVHNYMNISIAAAPNKENVEIILGDDGGLDKDTTILAATSNRAGVMSALQAADLSNAISAAASLSESAFVSVLLTDTDSNDLSRTLNFSNSFGMPRGTVKIPVATVNTSGLMSYADKLNLDELINGGEVGGAATEYGLNKVHPLSGGNNPNYTYIELNKRIGDQQFNRGSIRILEITDDLVAAIEDMLAHAFFGVAPSISADKSIIYTFKNLEGKYTSSKIEIPMATTNSLGIISGDDKKKIDTLPYSISGSFLPAGAIAGYKGTLYNSASEEVDYFIIPFAHNANVLGGIILADDLKGLVKTGNAGKYVVSAGTSNISLLAYTPEISGRTSSRLTDFDITIPAATTTAAGVMSVDDKRTLESMTLTAAIGSNGYSIFISTYDDNRPSVLIPFTESASLTNTGHGLLQKKYFLALKKLIEKNLTVAEREELGV